MRLLGWLLGSSRPSWQSTGRARFAIVGEASYQEALDTICGGRCEDGHEFATTASLRREPNNPHDPNAIAVVIDGKKVGYIPRAKAIKAASIMDADRKRCEAATCPALIVGGWIDEDGDHGHYGVRLALAWPPRLA